MPTGIYKRIKRVEHKCISCGKLLRQKRKNNKCTKCYIKERIVTDEFVQKMREISKKGNENRRWKGDYAGRVPKHLWVSRWRGKPRYCEHCKRTDRKRYNWANVDHKYRRVLEDYLRLCVSCHRKYDIKFLTEWNYIKCVVCGKTVKTKSKKRKFCSNNCTIKYYARRKKEDI